MRDIGKANFYKSYFLAAQKLDNDSDRLSLYDTIFNYIFEGVEPQELTLNVDLVFTSIKSFLDADLSRKLGGAPLGNSNAIKKQPKNNLENNPQNNSKTNKVEVEVEDNVNDKVEVEVSNLPTTFNNDYIINFATANGFKFGAKTIKELSESLSKTLDPKANLEGQLEFVKSKYPNKTGDELAKLFIASLHWNNKKTISKPVSSKIKIKPAPKSCTLCGSKLIMGGILNSWECPNCKPRTWWELSGDEWKCSRD